MSGGTNLGHFVKRIIPIESLKNDPMMPSAPIVAPETGKRWGQPATLYFSYDSQQSGANKKYGYKLDEVKDEYVVRNGIGVKQAKDREGKVVAESEQVVAVDNGFKLAFPIYNLFHCDTFDEYSEEVKTTGSLTVIQPYVTKVDLFLKWDEMWMIVWADLMHQTSNPGPGLMTTVSGRSGIEGGRSTRARPII